MAKQVSGKSPQVWQVASVWVKKRDGPERVRNAYRLLLDFPPRRAGREADLLALVPRHEQARGTERRRTPREESRDDARE
jgi:hypothetical protein